MRDYQDMVFSTAARLTGNPAQAEDIAQHVFLKAYENFDKLKGRPEAGGWLKTVAWLRKARYKGEEKIDWLFTLSSAAYNMVRMRNLVIAASG